MDNYIARRIGYLILGTFLIFSCPARSAPEKPVESGVVQLGAYDAVFDKRKVLIALSRAITNDSISRNFRISWGHDAAGAEIQGTVLYDRKNKTIKCWIRNSDQYGVGIVAILYRNATDGKISAIGKGFEEDINDFNSPQGNYYLDRLIEHNCSKVRVQGSFVEWPKR